MLDNKILIVLDCWLHIDKKILDCILHQITNYWRGNKLGKRIGKKTT
jgi:hypothetical protein